MRIIDLHKEPEYWPRFIELTDRVYEDDPFYVKQPSDPEKLIAVPKRPDNRLPLLAVTDDNMPIARLIVTIPGEIPVGESDKIGLIGFFESLDNPKTVKSIFDRAGAWLTERGITKIVGPMDGDTWHKYRFNVGPHDRPPFLMEPYNPPYYPKLWEEYGFEPLAGYLSRHIPELAGALPGLEKFYKRCVRNGFSFRSFRKADYNSELDILYDLSREIFSENFYYTEITRKSFRELYARAGAIIREDLIWFALDLNKQYCGFAFALPDYYEAVRSLRGRTDIFSKLRFIFNRRKARDLNVKSLGVLKKYQGSGLGPALTYKAYLEGFNLGFPSANMCLIHEANSSARLDGGRSELSRRYLLYQKLLRTDGVTR
ncbi:MAG: hypothetical protein KKG47_01310 [Proteobacteria bacterium]|nr:hypothetical protein [Pseudomonadota bacterium]MBU1736705.1 hypothetical protein [Pseudomonadota bacterium]